MTLDGTSLPGWLSAIGVVVALKAIRLPLLHFGVFVVSRGQRRHFVYRPSNDQEVDLFSDRYSPRDLEAQGFEASVDWTGCDLVERVPGKVSGRPIVRGTRILADTIVQDFELGSPLEEIQENYPDLPLAMIDQLIAFAQAHSERHVV